MGDKTKIDWADATWNPVTGCLHGCEYCYARGIANRFGCHMKPETDYPVLERPVRNTDTYAYMRAAGISAGKIQPYPFDFTPTFHRYRLDIPKHWTKPRNIFVCSMADLFGEWVPDLWIHMVFDACWAARQHRYIFLTKNPGRITRLKRQEIVPPPGSWIGTSITQKSDEEELARLAYLTENWDMKARWFVSVEPLLERLDDFVVERIAALDWVIIGAETGNRKGKVIPEKAWIDEIAQACKDNGTPVFMKESLCGIMDGGFRQEFPWET